MTTIKVLDKTFQILNSFDDANKSISLKELTVITQLNKSTILRICSSLIKHKFLIKNEINQLKQQTIQQFGGGQKIDMDMLPDDMFFDRAERRAALGIIVSELVKKENMSADADRIKSRVEEIASTYEKPSEVIE